jgi:hypothetical protein
MQNFITIRWQGSVMQADGQAKPILSFPQLSANTPKNGLTVLLNRGMIQNFSVKICNHI